MILFKATPRQVLQIVANAVNASYLASINEPQKADLKEYSHEDFKLDRNGIDIKTFGGRAVEIGITRKGELWKIAAGKAEPNPEFQTWADDYPTYRELVESVDGVQIVEEDLEPEEDDAQRN